MKINNFTDTVEKLVDERNAYSSWLLSSSVSFCLFSLNSIGSSFKNLNPVNSFNFVSINPVESQLKPSAVRLHYASSLGNVRSYALALPFEKKETSPRWIKENWKSINRYVSRFSRTVKMNDRPLKVGCYSLTGRRSGALQEVVSSSAINYLNS